MTSAVLIPVYNAFEDALECLQSVARHSAGCKVLVIDDASPQGEFSAHIPQSLFDDLELEVLRNEENLGFPGTCNRGFAELNPLDVVILNSDTVVTKGWLEKLHRAAASSSKVGTVTPLTNNGDLCSVPTFRANNTIPTGYSLDSFAELVEQVSVREYPQMPTCTGHCVYLKRELLDKTGGFDTVTFGKGYGEENDLSCRARSFGYVDILDDATFIFHKGECSFTDQSSDLRRKNFQALEKKHRHIADLIAQFISSNPLKGVQRRIQYRLLSEYLTQGRGLILHILHNGPFKSYGDPLGGTEKHVRDLIRSVSGSLHCSLVATDNSLWFTFHHPDFDCEFRLENGSQVLNGLLADRNFTHIHLHHSRWFNHVELLGQLATVSGYTVSIHDFVLGCPRFHLLTPKGDLCNRHECTKSCNYSADYITRYRSASCKVLENAARCIAFSKGSVELLKDMLPGNWSAELVPHGTVLDGTDSVAVNNDSMREVMRILILGSVAYHKGGDILRKLFRHKELFQGPPIEWHILGDSGFHSDSSNVFSHGKYRREDLADQISKIAPHVALFLSRAPETYSLAVDEALACKIPVVVSPRGAPAERVGSAGVGWVVPEFSESSVLRLLGDIQKDTKGYASVKRSLAEYQVPVLKHEMNFYQELYNSQLKQEELGGLWEFLSGNEQIAVSSSSRASEMVGGVVNQAIYLLDSLGVRRGLQSTVERIVPERIVGRLKRARRDSFLR